MLASHLHSDCFAVLLNYKLGNFLALVFFLVKLVLFCPGLVLLPELLCLAIYSKFSDCHNQLGSPRNASFELRVLLVKVWSKSLPEKRFKLRLSSAQTYEEQERSLTVLLVRVDVLSWKSYLDWKTALLKVTTEMIRLFFCCLSINLSWIPSVMPGTYRSTLDDKLQENIFNEKQS